MSLKPEFRINQDFVQLSSAHPVRIQTDIWHTDYPPHDHEFAELCVVWAGRGMHRTDAGLTPLHRGSMVVMMPGQVHAFERTASLRATNIYYLSEWLLGDLRGARAPDGVHELFLFQSLFQRPAWREIPQFELNALELKSVRREISDFEREMKEDSPSQFFLGTTFWRLLFRCARAFRRTSMLPLPQFPRDVQALLLQMEDALAQRRSFSLHECGTQMHLSVRHAGRRFKDFVGTSIMDYYQRRRIDVACHLLLDPGKSITEIAHELGFADAAHFSRSFRDLKHKTPRDFRKMFL